MGGNNSKTTSQLSRQYRTSSSGRDQTQEILPADIVSHDFTTLSISSSHNNDMAIVDNSSIFIAIQDFHSAVDSQTTIRTGEKVRLLGYSSTGQWAEVEHLSNGDRGCVPSTYLVPFVPVPNYNGNDALPSGPLTPGSVGSGSGYGSGMGASVGAGLEMYPWFHGAVLRQTAEHLLQSGINGSYLVRDSEGYPGMLSITVRFEARVLHYRISRDANKMFFVTESQRFPSVCQLIQHHSTNADGLACPLLFPAPKRSRINSDGMDPVTMDTWEIDRTEIIMKQKLGGGQYGDVYEAVWKRCNTVVAVKTVKEDVTLRVSDLLDEASVMKNLRHRNLVQLLGVCTREPPFYLVAEYMAYGNLLQYLRGQPREDLTPQVLFYMATQIAAGMAYLEKNNFIHRDLAARNCLIGESHLVKVADFGLARYMECDDTYTARYGAKFPIKWTAPEGLAYNKFSCRSDVWSYGVVLWELCTYGQAPYPGVEMHQVYHLLEAGNRMDRPPGCPPAVYTIMQQCWQWKAQDRPTFVEIHADLRRMLSCLDANTIQEIQSEFTQSLQHQKPQHPTPNYTHNQPYPQYNTQHAVTNGNNSSSTASNTPSSGHFRRAFTPSTSTQPGSTNSSRRMTSAPPPNNAVANAVASAGVPSNQNNGSRSSLRGSGRSGSSRSGSMGPGGHSGSPSIPTSLTQSQHTTAYSTPPSHCPASQSESFIQQHQVSSYLPTSTSAPGMKVSASDKRDGEHSEHYRGQDTPDESGVGDSISNGSQGEHLDPSHPPPSHPPPSLYTSYTGTPLNPPTQYEARKLNNSEFLSGRSRGATPPSATLRSSGSDSSRLSANRQLPRHQQALTNQTPSLQLYENSEKSPRPTLRLNSPGLSSNQPLSLSLAKPLNQSQHLDEASLVQFEPLPSEARVGRYLQSLDAANCSSAGEVARTDESISSNSQKNNPSRRRRPPRQSARRDLSSSSSSSDDNRMPSRNSRRTGHPPTCPISNLPSTTSTNANNVSTDSDSEPQQTSVQGDPQKSILTSDTATEGDGKGAFTLLAATTTANSNPLTNSSTPAVEPTNESKEALFDEINDLILQAEFLCATYPKLTSDVDHLVHQLTQCRSRALIFASSSPQCLVSRDCRRLSEEVAKLAQCTGATQPAVINRSLASVQEALVSLKNSLQTLQLAG